MLQLQMNDKNMFTFRQHGWHFENFQWQRFHNFSLYISYICTFMYTSLLSLIIWFLKNHIFLCNPFPCVTRRRFSCPSDHFLCILHWIIIWHPVSPSACRFRQVSLYLNEPTFCIWIVENRERGRIIWICF